MIGRPDITQAITALERRVAALEAQTVAPYRELRSPDGKLRVRVGAQPDGKWGLRVLDAQGGVVFDHTTA